MICFSCKKDITHEHTEGDLRRCLKLLSAQCNSIKTHTEALSK